MIVLTEISGSSIGGMSVATITIIFASIFSLCICITIFAVIIRVRMARRQQLLEVE